MIVLTEVLIVAVTLAYIAAVFAVVYFVGEKTFWGKSYLRQGYRILLSRRFDAYLFTAVVLDFAIPLIVLCVCDKSILLYINAVTKWGLFVFFVVMLLCSWLLEKICIFYNDEGLLLSKPFQRLRFVPWSEIESIQKKNTSAQLYNVVDRSKHRIGWFPLTKKTQPFLDLAQEHGVSVYISKGDKMVLNTSSKKLKSDLGDWNTAIAMSAYSNNDLIAIATFPDFIVALFMDRQLNMDNVIAINRDGTTRWKISEIIKRPKAIPYSALSQENANTISVMAVAGWQYHYIIYEIDVYAKKIIRQYSREDV